MLDVAKLDEFLVTSVDHRLQRRTKDNRLGKLQNLIALIEEHVSSLQERRNLRQLLADSQPRQSKWVCYRLALNGLLTVGCSLIRVDQDRQNCMTNWSESLFS